MKNLSMCSGWFLCWIMFVLLSYQIINTPEDFKVIEVPSHFTIGLTTFTKPVAIMTDKPIWVMYSIFTSSELLDHGLWVTDRMDEFRTYVNRMEGNYGGITIYNDIGKEQQIK